ncbi:MAG TPA: HAD-IA family hydrolase [Egibacteraceae bacterium]|nr:HAD-IA family hydrolase [Egibacteraceae bacterium]
MRLPAPKGVLFDAGGTLVQVHTGRLGEALRSRGHEPGDLDDAFWQALVRVDSEFGMGTEPFAQWFPRWLARMAVDCGVPEESFADVWRAADEAQHLWDHPLPGAAECLQRLRSAGLRVGVVSNSDGRVAEALGRARLADLVEIIIDSEVVGVAKPDPAIFAYALEPLGLAAEETWYLGDTVSYDAAGADAAGLTSWVIDHWGLHTHDHPRLVRSLTEFTDAALAALSQGRVDDC